MRQHHTTLGQWAERVAKRGGRCTIPTRTLEKGYAGGAGDVMLMRKGQCGTGKLVAQEVELGTEKK